MKWLLYLLLPFCLNAQCLKPGTYRNLKPTGSLILDTGCYTLIGLDMKDLGDGVWIDGRKAQKLDLLNCTFEGKDEGTAILSSGDLSVSHSTFTNLKEGILQASPPGSKKKVRIVSNVFRNNGTSIRLEVAKDGGSGLIKSGLVSVREDTNRGGESNIIGSASTEPGRNHVGLSNDGWTQMGVYRNNTLKDLSVGIRGILSSRFQIKSNQFKDNDIAISLEDLPGGASTTGYQLALNCNEFIHTLSTTSDPTPQRKGLVIGPNVQVSTYDGSLSNPGWAPNQIGGPNPLNYYLGQIYLPVPGGNVWPTAQEDRSYSPVDPNEEPVDIQNEDFGWADVQNWTPIENNSGTTITYFRYENEFVKNNISALQDIDFSNPAIRIATQGNTLQPGQTYEYACDSQTDPWPILFPARIGVVNGTVEFEKAEAKDQLYDAIPNPVQSACRIPFILSQEAEQASLQILEAGTGRVLQNIPIEKRGTGEVLLDLSIAKPGVYSFRLLINGVPGLPKKLMLTR